MAAQTSSGGGEPPAVHIYLACPEDQDARGLELAWSLLDDEERAQADRFRFDHDRQLYVVAHGLVRLVLAGHTGRPAKSLRFSRSHRGRPELVGDPPGGSVPPLRFNLSHTRGLVGCAVSPLAEVGLDVEAARDKAPLDVANRYFAPEELDPMLALPEGERSDRFFTLWTLKESYMKGRGLGLYLPLDAFAVHPRPDGVARVNLLDPGQDDRRPWTFRWWKLGPHFAAVAVQTDAAELGIVLKPDLRLQDLTGV